MKVRRIVAGLIDWGIPAILSVFVAIGLLVSGKAYFDMTCGFVVYTVVYFIYVIFKDLTFRNASIGKRIMGICIVKKGSEEKASILDIIIRSAVVTIPIMVYVELFMILISGNRLADKWFDTTVVRKHN